MKHSNKIMSTCFSVALGMFALTGCEGGELFDVNAPDWISDKIQEIEDSENDNQDEIVLEGMMKGVCISCMVLPPCPFSIPPWSAVTTKIVSFSMPASVTAWMMRLT